MSTITILPEQGEDQPTTFSAITTGRKATGRTVGEALDALTSQLSPEETCSPVIVQQFHPDQYFSSAQRDRLATLMARRQAARETGEALTAAEQSELERLVDEEVQGAGERAAHMLRAMETAQLRSPYQEPLSELKAMREQKGRIAWQLYRTGLVANLLNILVVIVSLVLVLIFRDSSTGIVAKLVFGILILTLFVQALLIFLIRRDYSALEKTKGPFLQDKSLESSSGPGKRREQTEAR